MTNYIIKRNGKRFNNKVWDSYEAARSYVRKWLRIASASASEKRKVDKELVRFDYSWREFSNPSINKYNFSVERKGVVKDGTC